MDASQERSPSKTCYKISWDETYQLCEKLILDIKTSKLNVHTIGVIMSGGLIPASFLAYHLNLDLKLLYTPPLNYNQKGVILIDDVWDTGATARNYVEDSKWKWEATIGIVCKPWCTFKPTYMGQLTDKWVVFPWET